ncbi:MAG: hypothetical protein ABI421_06605, partial [Polyangiaceae bacterium]
MDARRGPTAMCLSCGATLPSFSTGQSSSSGVLVAILGVGAVLAMLIVGGAIYFAVHLKTEAAAGASTSTVAIESTAQSTTASASASSAPKISAPLTDEEKDQLDGNYQCAMDDTP